jgi:hypothetical protein
LILDKMLEVYATFRTGGFNNATLRWFCQISTGFALPIRPACLMASSSSLHSMSTGRVATCPSELRV